MQNTDTQLILDKLNKIEAELEKTNKRIEAMEKSTNKMDKHISFVESIYDTIKAPMSDFLLYYYGNSKQQVCDSNTIGA